MKIAVSSMGNTLDSQLNPRFGRSSGFVVYDTETEQAVYLDNSQNLGLPQGAGIKTAQMIADSGAKVLISGQLGPKAAQALSQSNIKVYSCDGGTVRDAIKAYQENRLSELSGDKKQMGSGKTGGRGMGGGGGQGMGGGGRGGGRGQGMGRRQ
ncbi:MAG: NifB/NifX family molybdenum-iron cluster-binding protein [Desulfobacterales bacterium]|nr:NifB/NifX family molybdenum-iron cluster-binding protein [Desulfobacterales bacterium]